MRNIKSYISAVAIASVMLSAVSCKKDYYTKANVNPNSPKNVPNGTLLSGVEVSTAYIIGGDLSRFTSMFVQQTFGVSRQSAAYYGYVFTNQDPESAWDNMYDDVMANDYLLMQQASKQGAHEYYGMGQIMMAYALQVSVDCWGSEPYSQAFKGSSNLQPAYDGDKALYDTAIALCNRGIANLNPTLDATDAVSPDPNSPKYDNLGGDVMYSGSGAQWIKFAHAILARLYIHQTKHNAVAMCDSAIANVAASFTSNSDDAQVAFGTSSTNNNPWYQFNTQRGDIEFAFMGYTNGVYTTFADSLLKESDPRFTTLIDSVNEPVTGNGLNAFYGSPNSPVPFITYSEMLFVKTEAELRSGTLPAAAEADYVSAITANFNKLGVATGTFLTGPQGNIATLTAAQAIVQNAWQENVAIYLNPEVWTLWRRCDWTVTPTSGTAVPRRFLYPQSELNLNAANTPAATQFSPVVFWDN